MRVVPNVQCIFASDGQEGIDLAIKIVPDLIISDLMMPVKTGFELVKEEEMEPLITLRPKHGMNMRVTPLAK